MMVSSVRTTRSTNEKLLRLPLYKTTTLQESIFYKGVKDYNKIPINIRESDNVNIFKRQLKTFLCK